MTQHELVQVTAGWDLRSSRAQYDSIWLQLTDSTWASSSRWFRAPKLKSSTWLNMSLFRSLLIESSRAQYDSIWLQLTQHELVKVADLELQSSTWLNMSLFRSLLIESSKAATEEMMDRVKSAVGFPCIVKPNRGAACTGIMKLEEEVFQLNGAYWVLLELRLFGVGFDWYHFVNGQLLSVELIGVELFENS